MLDVAWPYEHWSELQGGALMTFLMALATTVWIVEELWARGRPAGFWEVFEEIRDLRTDDFGVHADVDELVVMLMIAVHVEGEVNEADSSEEGC